MPGLEIRAESFERRLKALGWTSEKLAQRAGLGVGDLRAMLDGGRLDLRAALAVAEALGVPMGALFVESSGDESQLVVARSGPADPQEDLDRQTERVRRLVESSSRNGMMTDPREYLRRLNHKADVLRREGSSAVAMDLVTGEIKRFCLSSEQFLAVAATEQAPGSSNYFSCSSLIDTGPVEYLADSGWLLLLRSLARAKKRYGGRFVRIFFIDPTSELTPEQNAAIVKVLRLHLEAGVEVMVVSQEDIEAELLAKRNMALFGGKELLHATDQVSWDLEYSSRRDELDSALSRHRELQYKARIWLRPDDEFSKMFLRFAGETGLMSSLDD